MSRLLIAVSLAVAGLAPSFVERPLRAQSPEQAPGTLIVDDMILFEDQLVPDGPFATSVFSVYTRPWPGGIIPIAFDGSVSAGQRAQFLRNCNVWGTRAPGVGCVTRTTEPVPLNVYNRSLPFSGGQSTVGYSATGRNELSITPNAWSDSLILHEVGHAFGFMHEHQRSDRDNYVTIDASNILTGYAGNFSLLPVASSQVYGPYDFQSIMHYFPTAFAIDARRPTIIARPPYQAFQNVMGRATTLSNRDLGGIVAIYGTPPDTPVDLSASLGAGSVSLGWRQPLTGGRPAYYDVAVGTSPGASNLGTFNVGPATSVSGSVAPGTYFARVTAVNERAASASSAELAFTVTAAAPPPGAPRDFAVTAAGSTLTLTWHPALTGGAVGSYIVQAGSASGLSDIHNGPVGTMTTLTAIVPVRTYYIRVLAQNGAGLSPPSSEVRVDVTAHCVVPSAPVLSATRAGNVVSASWSIPAGGPISHFVLQAGRSPGGTDLFHAPVGVTTSASGTLAPGTYYVRVSAAADCGSGPSSNEVAVQVP